ncbi:MAG: Na+/H+ antiporter NhaA [Dehalococcoidales bacterium]|nr:Na+/H+ antiporter NhaA [Dehalococcoidales bacterium]
MAKINENKYNTKPGISVVIENFLAKESLSGVFLFGAALIAMIWANSFLSVAYFDLWNTHVSLSIGGHAIDMSLGHWINDGLMALFFLLIGLEIKREMMVGELSSLRQAAFPVVAAIGGVTLPALFYILVNLQQGGQMSGFAIPMATDIAFVLGFLLILGSRAPLSLKIFITSIAVVDDLVAIAVIAIFYTGSIDFASLGYAAIVIAALIVMNRTGIKKLLPYLLLGAVLWFFVEASGIHATIAGVALALTIPVRSRITGTQFLNVCRIELTQFKEEETNRKSMLLTSRQQDALEEVQDAYDAVQNPLVRLEHQLHPFSAFIVMPIFALANAGVQISGVQFSILQPVSLGIILGLVFGKPLGIIGFTYLASRFGWVKKPSSLSWKHIIGAGMLCGVGFTMSIFITNLAFEDAGMISLAKLTIVACSLLMGIAGVFYLWRACKKNN